MHHNPLLVGLLAALPLASGAIITGSHVPLTGYHLSWTIDDTAATIEVTIAEAEKMTAAALVRITPR